MKKLEDIEKKDIFKVPDGYFESLPSIIQSRVAEKREAWNPALVLGLRYALPVLVLSLSLLWFFKAEPEASPEKLIASVSSEDIAEYLNSMDITSDDFLESLDYSQINADSLDLYELDIPLNDADMNDLLLEFDTESITDEKE
jgi:hypothetical protein